MSPLFKKDEKEPEKARHLLLPKHTYRTGGFPRSWHLKGVRLNG